MIKREDLGHLTVGAPADVAILRLEKGKFGFLDQSGGRLNGSRRLACELTLRDGTVACDQNGLAAPRWETMPPPPQRAR